MCRDPDLRSTAATGIAPRSALTRVAPLNSTLRTSPESPLAFGGDPRSELEVPQPAFRISGSAVAARSRDATRKAAVGTSSLTGEPPTRCLAIISTEAALGAIGAKGSIRVV
jgi:hypothetical protein